MSRTVETLDGLEVPIERVISYRVVHLSIVDGPVVVKVMILTDKLGEAVEKQLKLGFKSMTRATEYMDALMNLPREITSVGSSQLHVIRR